jgi:hypothetical protein
MVVTEVIIETKIILEISTIKLDSNSESAGKNS